MPQPYKPYFWVIVCLLISFNIYRAVSKPWNYGDPIDFRGIWIGSQLLDSNAAFYDIDKGKSVWLEAKTKEGFTSSSDFGDKWVSIAVYPPQTFNLFYILGQIPWKVARVIWWIICFLSFGIAGFLLYKKMNEVWVVGLLLASSASFFALSLGQPFLFCFALLLLAIHTEESQPVLAGILIGVSLIKFTLIFPFLFWFLARKKWKIIGASIATFLLLALPLTLFNLDIWTTYLSQLNEYYQLVHTLNPSNNYTFSNSEFVGLFNYYFATNPATFKYWILALTVLASTAVSWFLFKGKISSGSALLGLLLISFVGSYHLSYDVLLFLIPLILIKDDKLIVGIVGGLLLLSLPINRVFNDYSIMKFNYPFILLIGLLIWALYSFKRNKQLA